MESERGMDPGLNDMPRDQATPTETVKAGLGRAGAYVKDAVDRTREKVASYREDGIEQASRQIVEYVRSQPKTALLIASGVGLVVGVLLSLGRK